MLYHGVRRTASGSIYRLGLALLDREKPERVILRGDEWIFGPEERYEREGDVPNEPVDARQSRRPGLGGRTSGDVIIERANIDGHARPPPCEV